MPHPGPSNAHAEKVRVPTHTPEAKGRGRGGKHNKTTKELRDKLNALLGQAGQKTWDQQAWKKSQKDTKAGKKTWDPKKPKKVPANWEGMRTHTHTYGGKPLCFVYNSAGGCPSGKKAGETCDKGLHVCAREGCKDKHSATEHPP